MPRTLSGVGRKYNYDAVLDYIIVYKRFHDGNSPGFAQISRACGISSMSVLSHILDSLEGDGKISRSGIHGICVTGGQWSIQR